MRTPAMLFVLCFFISFCSKNGANSDTTAMQDIKQMYVVVAGFTVPRNTTVLNLGGKWIDSLNGIGKLKDLEVLNVCNNPIVFVGELVNLSKIRKLNISRTYITNFSFLDKLKSLKELNILRVNIKSCASIPGWIEVLYIDKDIGSDELAKYKKVNPSCRILHTDGSVNLKYSKKGPIKPLWRIQMEKGMKK